MIPLPTNPTVVLLLDNNDTVVGVSSNIDSEVKIEVTRSQRLYDTDLTPGLPFRKGTTGNDNP